MAATSVRTEAVTHIRSSCYLKLNVTRTEFAESSPDNQASATFVPRMMFGAPLVLPYIYAERYF
jgi:hypothetical protein